MGRQVMLKESTVITANTNENLKPIMKTKPKNTLNQRLIKQNNTRHETKNVGIPNHTVPNHNPKIKKPTQRGMRRRRYTPQNPIYNKTPKYSQCNSTKKHQPTENLNLFHVTRNQITLRKWTHDPKPTKI